MGQGSGDCAHNYEKHFGRFQELQPGTQLSFTDMDGNVWDYAVAKTVTVDPQAVEEVTRGDYALTLITCTYGGKARVVLYCDTITEKAENRR